MLGQLEYSTWHEVMALMTGGERRPGALNKFIPVNDLSPAAQRRLVELDIKVRRLFQFRLGNLARLWGVLVEETGTFYPILYDSARNVCPSADSN
jgi:hypothetical protein